MRSFVTLVILWIACTAAAQEAAPQRAWKSSIGAGLALTSGNTETRNYNLSFNTAYDAKTRVRFEAEALALRGESNGQTQVDRITAAARGEYTISDGAFAFVETSLLRDPFKDIEYLVAPVAGAGYRIIATGARTLTVDGALGMRFEENETLGRSSDGAVKAGESFEWELSPSSRITQKFTALWNADDFGDALYHADIGLVTSVMTRVELKIAYAYDYQTDPPSATLERGDSALFAALLFKF